MVNVGPLTANYAPFATWAASRAPRATGSASNGTTQVEASTRANTRDYATLHVGLTLTITFFESPLIRFTGKSSQPTAASFVRPSRPSEPPRSFLEALREKYASDPEQEDDGSTSVNKSVPQNAIKISSKVVEEVGFDKIRRQMAELQELRIVILDGLRLAGVLSSYDQAHGQAQEFSGQIEATCPKIVELDLSRNLLTRWHDVWEICNQLKHLRRLKVK